MKNVSVLKEDAAFAVFFRPTLGDLTAQKSPPPEFAIQGKKKMLMPGGQPGGGGDGWAQVELTDAYITSKHTNKTGCYNSCAHKYSGKLNFVAKN